jgi:hypothetical protein
MTQFVEVFGLAASAFVAGLAFAAGLAGSDTGFRVMLVRDWFLPFAVDLPASSTTGVTSGALAEVSLEEDLLLEVAVFF